MSPTSLKGEVRLWMKEMCFLWLFCRQDVRHSLATLSLSNSLIWFNHEPMTAADLLGNVTEKSASSLVAPLLTQSSIFQDHNFTRASKTDERVIQCENERMCLCSRSAYIDPSPLSSAHIPSLTLEEVPTWDLKFTLWFLPRIQSQKAHLTPHCPPPVLNGPLWDHH